MELIKKGKTKDVYKLPNGNYQLLFKDDVTGTDGVFDPGANTVGARIEGIGRENLRVSVYFFDLLKKRGVLTHYVGADLDRGAMEVIGAEPFGQGLEVICRLRAVGSFIRRYGAYIESGTALPYYVEMTLKDDERGDPLITMEALEVLGILTEAQYKDMSRMTKEIVKIIADELAKKGLELYDIKLEFGNAGGKVLLMDEIASGNMRAYKDGKVVDPMELTKIILG